MHSFITIKEIARQALPRLIENLVFPNLIYKDYSETFVAGKGAKIQVKKPVKLIAQEFSGQTVPQDINESSVEVTLDKLATVDVEFSAIESATNIDDLNRMFTEPAAVALAQKINSDGLELYRDIPYFTGEAGTVPGTLEALSGAREMLNTNLVPTSPRYALFDTKADAALVTVPAIVNAEKSGTTKALREGSLGRVMGFDNYMSQAVKKHVTGIKTATAVKVSGAVSAGATSLAISGTALTGKLVKGDLLVIGGKSYTVTADTADADTNAIAKVTVYPALPELADKTEVKLIGSHTANLAFHPSAFAFVTRPLSSPSGVESYVTSYNGITLRVVKGYNIEKKKEMLSMDVLYGYKTMYEELAGRVIG